MATEIDEEPPLDPVLENVRRKLVRRMAWSLGIMMIGLMTVLGAIVYKISFENEADGFVGAGEPYALQLGSGVSVDEVDLDGDRILLRVRLEDGSRQLVLIDMKTGDVLSRIALP
jgi:hypothetical protein